ncbi:hypothetical protein [Paraliomyxa miuraensis]|uniref:hypothetical protein n=1 Tax=Paraliomyxa miuraensis TaxID=376150 RepID=UPI0022575731|nr:hypothetical protein [Paraliomyxa miuraensis]MCX4246336.1 hypothetical protein [Paraliomyxa miuraensis]
MATSGKVVGIPGHGTCVSILGLALAGCLIGENPYWDPQTAGSQSTGSDSTATTSSTSNGTATSGSTGNTTPMTTTATGSTGETDGTTGPVSTMGQPCAVVGTCDAGQSCCRSPQCLDTCAVFCGVTMECPDGLICAHGYCLLPCNDDDGDCASWPGFTCQHPDAGGADTLCENGTEEGTGTGTTGT